MPPIVRQFITDDEVNESLSGGSGFSGGKARIYEYWQEGHSAKEKADFLKNEYGTGGHSHALSGASGSGEDHDAKGIRYTKSGCDKVQLSWTQVANRIDSLIKQKRYFDKDTLEQYRQEQQVAEQSAPSEPEEWEQVDGTAIREALEHRSMEKSPFIQQVMRDAEAIAAGEESYERFSVIETENGYAVWDDIRDEIYVDDEGVSEEFTSEWQANDYLQEVKKAVSEKKLRSGCTMNALNLKQHRNRNIRWAMLSFWKEKHTISLPLELLMYSCCRQEWCTQFIGQKAKRILNVF